MATHPVTRIVILGAGYGGMVTTMRLAGKTRRQNVEITLVNGDDRYVHRIRLHEYATSQPVKTRSIPEMLDGTGVRFVQGWVTALHPEQQQVSIQTDKGQQQLDYDYLVYALGSTIDRDRVPGVREHTYVLNPGGDLSAEALKTALPALANRGGRVLVVGGGATGIEGATEFKALYPELHVSLVTQGEVGAFKGRRVQRHIKHALTEQDINMVEHARVERVAADSVTLTNGESLPFDLCLWSGGFKAQPIPAQAGLSVNERGQVLTDPYLRALNQAQIFVIGDAAQPVAEPGAPTRMSVFNAVVMGAHTADTLNRIVRGKPIKPLSFAYYGQAIALGPKDAVGFSTYPADKPIGPIFRRGLAVAIRNFFVWFLGNAPLLEKRLPGIVIWLGHGRFARAQRRLGQREATQTA